MQVLNLHARDRGPISMLSGLIPQAGQSGTSPDPRHTLCAPLRAPHLGLMRGQELSQETHLSTTLGEN